MKVVFILARGKSEYRDPSAQVGYHAIFGAESGVLYHEQTDSTRSYEKNILQEKKSIVCQELHFFQLPKLGDSNCVVLSYLVGGTLFYMTQKTNVGITV